MPCTGIELMSRFNMERREQSCRRPQKVAGNALLPCIARAHACAGLAGKLSAQGIVPHIDQKGSIAKADICGADRHAMR